MQHFTRGQRNGIIVLSAVLILISIVPTYIIRFSKPDYQASFKTMEKNIDNMRKPEKTIEHEKKQITNQALIPFDPNIASDTQLLSFGLPQKLVKQWVNFVNKGGKFKSSEDLKKLYAINDSIFAEIEPYIEITESERKHAPINTKKQKFEKKDVEKALTISVDIAIANEQELQTVNGIGPTFAKRIVKYRESLGGYYKLEQLKEVYGIDDEKFEALKKHLVLNTKNIKTLNINLINAKTLSSHPYFDYRLAKKIIKDRNEKGRFKDLNDLLNRLPEDHLLITKAEVYLSF
ncbi:MAG: helix-hairpin-helix domain-containing protein [Bacteroidales bacterium]|nr:helix-hairpin-helix domain-containing protein [Bacteroidales bacterium]